MFLRNHRRLVSHLTQPLQLRWRPLFIVTPLSILAGSLIGYSLNEFLVKFDLYHYVPEDDDEEEEKMEEIAPKRENLKLFGDFHLGINFLWNNSDVDAATLMKEKIQMELSDFRSVLNTKTTLTPLDREEAKVTEEYLVKLVSIYSKRENALRKSS